MKVLFLLFQNEIMRGKLFTLIALLLIFCSCSVTKHVPDHEYLLNKVKIEKDTKVVSESTIRQYIRQKPNSRILGSFPMSLRFYSLSGTDTTKWINRFLRRNGEAPVIYDKEKTETSTANITRLMQTKGYADAEVTTDTVHKGKKKLNLTYRIKSGEPYKIAIIDYAIEDDTLRAYILPDTTQRRVNVGDRFDIDELKAERTRIVSRLKQQGFYYANVDHLYIEADTTLGEKSVQVTFKSRPLTKNNPNGSIDTFECQPRLRIRDVNIYPWFYTDGGSPQEQAKDSIVCGNIRYYYGYKRRLCPKTVYMKTFTLPGNYYDENDVNKTNAALSSLPTTKYTSLFFVPVKEAQDSLLDAYVLVSPNRMQSYSIEAEGTNTEGDIGAAINTTYTHRNVFRSANTFNFKTRMAYQPMGDLADLLSDRTLDLGTEVSLTFPRVLFPFISEKLRRRIRANTELATSANWQTTPWYDRFILSSSFKYLWTTGSRNTESYSIAPIDLSFVYLPEISNYFRNNYLGENSVIRYSYQDHMILAASFSFSRHNHTKPNRNFFSYRGTVETAGNVLHGICSLVSQAKDSVGYYDIMGIRFSQYVKGEFDYSFCQVLGQKSNIVYHFRVGAAYPYGNADVVPYEKRFFSGGANSVRGWSVRTLGPGTYKSPTSRANLMQAGDLSLDLNVEYRFKLFWLFEGAAFVDAGNIWTIKDYEDQPGGTFDAKTFYKQLAMAYGLGLRLDFSFFVLRCDVGSQLHDPAGETPRKRWRHPLNIHDMALHLAIGYPF